MGLPKFTRPKGEDCKSTPNLYVANCGPALGISYESIQSVFTTFGKLQGVCSADESGARVIISYADASSAEAALTALDGLPCPDLGGRALHIRYSIAQPNSLGSAHGFIPVLLEASELNIPGLYLLHDFITAEEEQELLAAVDDRPWINLSKRRVQHYGFEFCYETRNVNTEMQLGELPSFVSPLLERLSLFKKVDSSASFDLDQLTVNEYPLGVGLSPHIDTHSAFEGLIFSLSLAGPCMMEFRRYFAGEGNSKAMCSNFLRRAIYLPPRSMLLLSGEARYAWQHYIPHHKIDMVKDHAIRRATRRVSFTLRKVRRGPCGCKYPQQCDSQRS